MANHIAAIRNIVAGIEVTTGHLYGLYLNFDKLTEIINDALNSVEPDHEGNLLYRYKSRVKTTVPFRTLMIEQVRYVPNQWYKVKDVGHNAFGGLEVFRFENFHLFKEQPKLIKDERTGLLFEYVTLEGWD